MRVSSSLVVVALASTAAAVPTPSVLSSILGVLTNDLTTLLSSLGIKLQTNAASTHGPTVNYQGQCPFPFPAVTASNDRFSHDITWPKAVNDGQFLNWTTFNIHGLVESKEGTKEIGFEKDLSLHQKEWRNSEIGLMIYKADMNQMFTLSLTIIPLIFDLGFNDFLSQQPKFTTPP